MKKLLLIPVLVVAMSANAAKYTEGSQYTFRYDGPQPGSATVQLYSSWQGDGLFQTIELDEGVNRQRTVGTTNNLHHIDVVDHADGARYRFLFDTYPATKKGKPLNLTLHVDPSAKTIKVRENAAAKGVKWQSFNLSKVQ